MDHAFSIWHVSTNHTSNATPAVVAAARGNMKIVKLGGSGSTGQLIEAGTSRTFQQHAGMTEPILLQIPEQRQYIVDESSIQNIDQMPPVNLIMGTVDTCDDSSPLVATSGDGQVYYDSGCGKIMQSTSSSSEQMQYAQECEVMEEVITDDWVQSQGEECVQVTVDQLGASTTVGTAEDDISVPLDQDEYTLSRPFPCDFCSRRFRKKTNLLSHLVAHSNDRPYVCNLCGAQYGRRIDLTNHFKQHAYAANDHDETALSRQSDNEIDYDIPSMPMQYHTKQRLQQSSEDDDMFVEGTRSVSYNSQPPMQLISSTNTAATSVYANDSVDRMQYNIDPGPMIVPILEDGSYSFSAPIGESGSFAPAHQSSEVAAGPYRNNRQASRVGKQGFQKQKRKNTANRIKKEPATTNVELFFSQDEEVTASNNFPVIDERKPFVCQLCGASFGREKALASHSRMHEHDRDMQYRCSNCDERFWDRSLLQYHVRQHHPDVYSRGFSDNGGTRRSPKMSIPITTNSFIMEEIGSTSNEHTAAIDGRYICDSCHTVFDQPEHIKEHIQEAHGTISSQISQKFDRVIVKQELSATISHDIANEPTKDTVEYDGQQTERDTQQNMLCCRDCGKTFKKSTELLVHCKKVHAPVEPHECQLCGVKFPNESIIKLHVQEYHSEELTDTSCAICGKLCKSQTSLMKHSFDHSRERSHCCSKCGKTFHHMGRLKRHMGSHRNKTVRCEVCGEEFPDGRTLMNHRHSHSKSSNYPCKECGKTFGSRSSQQIHLRIHTGERPYACRFCWKAFADGGTLRKHERVHTGEKPYGCSVCPKEFNQRVVLREHIRAHHSQPDTIRGNVEQPFFCPVCGSLFATASALVQDLIEHSDNNTAQKRKPPTFPRKYKRRRKLKPHELERLQSGGRRKQKVSSTTTKDNRKQSDDEESMDGEEEDGQHQRTVSLEREDGTLKSSRDLLLEYGGSKIQKLAVVSSKFISPYELLGESACSADQPKDSVADDMLDDNGINLLSNVVLMHGQDDTVKREGSSKINNNHLSESPNKRKGKKGTSGEAAQPGTTSCTSGSRMNRTQVLKRGPASKPLGDTKRNKKLPVKTSLTENLLSTTASKAEDNVSPAPAVVGVVPNVLEAFSELERKRSRRGPMPTYVREIPSDKISGNFPLLDDGNIEDTMEESFERGSNDRTTRPYIRQRHISSASSVTRDDEDEQLLMEISRQEKYSDRFNSDIVNDLAEILRSPLKGATGATTAVPPIDILASPSSRHALFFPSIKQEKISTKQVGRTNKPRTNSRAKQRAAAPCTLSNANTHSASQDPYSASAIYSHGRRLTRRQLEREVNFLSEAFQPEISNPAPSKVTNMGTSTTVSEILIGEGRSTICKQENVNTSEKLAEMLLNDGLPANSGNEIRNYCEQQEEQHHTGECEISTMQSLNTQIEGERPAEEAENEHESGTSDAPKTASKSASNSTGYQCSICAACFDDRSQLILHVPVHM